MVPYAMPVIRCARPLFACVHYGHQLDRSREKAHCDERSHQPHGKNRLLAALRPPDLSLLQPDAKDADHLVLAAIERALAGVRLYPHGDVDGFCAACACFL
jgi:hypothetical protein